MGLAVDQCWNDITQRAQWQVYLCCLFHTISSRTCFARTLWTGQIHQVQFWRLILLISLIVLLLRVNVNAENTVWSGRLSIHICSSCCSILKTDVHVLLHVGDTVDFNLVEILDEDTLFGAFLELHSSFGVFAQKVMNFLIVNFYKTATNQVGFTGLIFCNCYDLAECSRNDSLQLLIVRNTHHCVGLSTSSLTVSEYGAIISIENTVNEWKSALFINEVLRGLSSKDSVIGKAFWRFVIVLFDEVDLIVLVVDGDDTDAA